MVKTVYATIVNPVMAAKEDPYCQVWREKLNPPTL
jgi:hypothetical protein